MSYDVRVPNGNTTYTVFWSFDRDPNHEPDAGVAVEVNQKAHRYRPVPAHEAYPQWNGGHKSSTWRIVPNVEA